MCFLAVLLKTELIGSFRHRQSPMVRSTLFLRPAAFGAAFPPMLAKNFIYTLTIAIFLLPLHHSQDLMGQETSAHRQDQLRGSITPERAWWDLLHYHLAVQVFPDSQRLEGSNTITFRTQKPGRKMQIDLQPPLKITQILHDEKPLAFDREGNVYWVHFEQDLPSGVEQNIQVFYAGVPVESKNPPWSGGISWQKDSEGNHFIASSCQGIGASIWWPNKDHGYDEPDRGVQVSVTVPESLTAVSNGRLKKTDHDTTNATKTFHWEVVNPINNYSVNINIGNYVHFGDRHQGQGGTLDMDYWVLAHQKEKALKHFTEAPRTIAAFEHWFGKYPFYEDSYKLVAVPYAGMEHQSSVTYGNGYRNGYRGSDLSDTGVGMLFDFIIVHETGHEWFGNNISMKDAADMWIHEGFTNYSENLFVEYHFSQQQAQDYVIGCRRLVSNDRPIIGTYDLNQEGSGDMYYKGGNMLHTIRHVVDDDHKWLSILRGLNKDFWHQTVTTEQIESYISTHSGIDLSKVFDQYLRTVDIPVLEYEIRGETLSYRYENVVPGFAMPVAVTINGESKMLIPREKMQSLRISVPIQSVEINRNFYVQAKQIAP